jgi:hypothetical protein
MQNNKNLVRPAIKPIPWNKGQLIGAKAPLRQKHVWAIRSMLQIERRARDLAMFNLAIDSKLRGCDVVSLKVGDVTPSIGQRCVRERQVARFDLSLPSRLARQLTTT